MRCNVHYEHDAPLRLIFYVHYSIIYPRFIYFIIGIFDTTFSLTVKSQLAVLNMMYKQGRNIACLKKNQCNKCIVRVCMYLNVCMYIASSAASAS